MTLGWWWGILFLVVVTPDILQGWINDILWGVLIASTFALLDRVITATVIIKASVCKHAGDKYNEILMHLRYFVIK